MSDSRQNPGLDRFPTVKGMGTCVEGGLAGSARCNAAPAPRANFGAPTTGEVGWKDVPNTYEGGTIEAVGPLDARSSNVEMTIPTDRHSRGGTIVDQGRVRETELNTQPHRQARNMETRIVGECSRHIAHNESQSRLQEWKTRLKNECTACSAIP
jgi:hypothetical protein